MLNSPPATIPALPPFTRVTSHSMPVSNARMLLPLTVNASLSRRNTWTSIAWLARNISPEPDASMSLRLPCGRLLQQPSQPAALVLEVHVALVGDHRPAGAITDVADSSTFSSRGFWSVNGSPVSTS